MSARTEQDIIQSEDWQAAARCVRAYLLDTLNDLWQIRHLEEPAYSERWREADLRWQGGRIAAQNVCHGLRINWQELIQEVRDQP